MDNFIPYLKHVTPPDAPVSNSYKIDYTLSINFMQAKLKLFLEKQKNSAISQRK